jgi:hypothetical protein
MKKFVLACGLFGLLGVFGVGCGGNKCDAAADTIIAKYESCGIEVTTTTEGGETAECTDALGKQSECIATCTDTATCETLKGEDAEGAVKYAECLGGC